MCFLNVFRKTYQIQINFSKEHEDEFNIYECCSGGRDEHSHGDLRLQVTKRFFYL